MSDDADYEADILEAILSDEKLRAEENSKEETSLVNNKEYDEKTVTHEIEDFFSKNYYSGKIKKDTNDGI